MLFSTNTTFQFFFQCFFCTFVPVFKPRAPGDNCKGTQTMLVKRRVSQYFAREFLVLSCSGLVTFVFSWEAVTLVFMQRLEESVT